MTNWEGLKVTQDLGFTLRRLGLIDDNTWMKWPMMFMFGRKR